MVFEPDLGDSAMPSAFEQVRNVACDPTGLHPKGPSEAEVVYKVVCPYILVFMRMEGRIRCGARDALMAEISIDEGKTWKKERAITKNSPFNHTYARRPVNADPDFYAYWADGHGRQPSESRLYFCDSTGQRVLRLPTTMKRALQNAQPLE